MQGLVKQHLERARQIMKSQADKRRSDRRFSFGDWVFLKVQPYVQNSVADRASQKIAFRYFGPFQANAPTQDDQSRLPPPVPEPEDCQPDEPYQVLQRRQYLRGSTVRAQVLVQWSSMPESLATWEDETQLRARFPSSPAWGQAGVEGKGNVTPISATTTSKKRRKYIQASKAVTREDGACEPAGERQAERPRCLRQPSCRLNPKDWIL
uniref:Uncharacterized protein n=1 Tax=Avena sativa TaxID=4498 RepID=A0ACD6A284_AVESA